MSDIRGILFANGVQALAVVRKEDEQFLWVENMLALQMKIDEAEEAAYSAALRMNQDNASLPVPSEPVPKLYFEHFTPFAELTKTGLDTKIPHSAYMFTYPPESRILTGYKNRTSLIAHKSEDAPSIIVRS